MLWYRRFAGLFIFPVDLILRLAKGVSGNKLLWRKIVFRSTDGGCSLTFLPFIYPYSNSKHGFEFFMSQRFERYSVNCMVGTLVNPEGMYLCGHPTGSVHLSLEIGLIIEEEHMAEGRFWVLGMYF